MNALNLKPLVTVIVRCIFAVKIIDAALIVNTNRERSTSFFASAEKINLDENGTHYKINQFCIIEACWSHRVEFAEFGNKRSVQKYVQQLNAKKNYSVEWSSVIRHMTVLRNAEIVRKKHLRALHNFIFSYSVGPPLVSFFSFS